MKAKIHIRLNDGQAVEFDHSNIEQLSFNPKATIGINIAWDEVKELTIKPMVDNPNADVKQVFPKGRW
jgi:hypothetical protein